MATELPSVSILLATFNGAAFLAEQLRSIEQQQQVGTVHVFASDDGSTDGTVGLLESWQSRWTRGGFTIQSGPGRGFSENFRSLALRPEIASDYVAFSDQDDVWDPDKLATAVSVLEKQPRTRPGLYVSRTRLVDREGNDIGFSPLFRRPPAFSNAIVQSIGGGNTVVLDRRGFELFAESARRTAFVTHDWWCYIIVSGAGGCVHYDPTPHIAYRQHEDNVVGRNTGFRARAGRLHKLLAGRFAAWTEANLTALDCCADMLTDEARDTVASLRAVRATSGPQALARLRSSGIYRQTRPGNLALALAAVLGKV